MDIEGVICQVHEDMGQILLAWFLQNKNMSDHNHLYIKYVSWHITLAALKWHQHHSHGYLVGLGAKTCQAFLGNVNLQWLQGLYQYIEADIKLELVN